MLIKRSFSALATLIPLTFFACTQGPGSAVGGGGHMMGYGSMGGFMWLFILVLTGIGIYFLIQILKSKDADGSPTKKTLDILNRRYANGEISKDEFDQMKKDLGAQN